MGFVIDKQGNYLPVFGEATGGGGGGGTTNHAQLSNLDYEHAGHTGFMSSDNYIPNDTTFTVELDGTGDFTNVADAVNYLTGKWSDGRVIIQLGNGTFNVNSTITISGQYSNIKRINIYGKGKNNTIVNYNGTTTADRIFHANNIVIVQIKDMTLQSSYGTKVTRAISSSINATIYAGNVIYNNFSAAIDIFGQGIMTVATGSEFTNCDYGIFAEPGTCYVEQGAVLTFTNVTNAWAVQGGGVIRGGNAQCTYTNVTNKVSQTPGTATNNGWITALTV